MQLIDLLQRHNVSYREGGQHHHVRPGWVGTDCPACSPGSGRFRLGIRLDRPYARCWVCGPQKLTQTLALLTGQPAGEVYAWVRDLEREAPDETKRTGTLRLPAGLLPELHHVHRGYLKCRGFDPDEIERLWRVQSIGISSRLSWRLFVPILHRGTVVSWTTRAPHDKGLRYINAPASDEAVSAKSLLYGEDDCSPGHGVIVCEGPTDVWRVGPGAVATMGLVYTPEQVARMARYPVRVICYDAEPGAQRIARQLLNDLSVFPGTTTNVVLDGVKDPGGADEEQLMRLRRMIT